MKENLSQSWPYAFNDSDMETSIPQRFEQMVGLLAGRPAICTADRVWTYGELNRAANRIAHMIAAQQAHSDAPLALLFETDWPIFGAILGILKAGKSYSALNPRFSTKRNLFVVEDLQSDLILSDTKNWAQAQLLAGDTRQAINVEALDTSYPSSNPRHQLTPDTLAAIFYTSGTTGKPKGAIRSHANLLHRSLIAEHLFPSRPDDVVSMLYPCSVGASISDMYVALLSGAALNVYDIARFGAAGMASWLHQSGLTRLHLHSSVLRQFLDQLPADAFFPKLRFIRPSDRLYYREVRRLRRHVSAETAIVHGLSSSEAGNVTLFKIGRHLGADDEIVPMGFPVPAVDLSLIDENGQQVPPGATGEIAVGGPSVALGYWRRAQLTAEKFQFDPSGTRHNTVKMGDLGRINDAGYLELVGRRDQMVKILGHRVEMGAVEASLESLAGVSRAAVMVHEDHFGDQILAAYVQLGDTEITGPSTIRRQLQELLPSHMIPSRILFHDKLPMLPNGKVNRHALPAPGTSRPLLEVPFKEPRTPVEAVLADIWSEVLGYDQVGIDDNFLDLGGNSLQAARIIGRVLRRYQVDLTLRALFDSPTIASMALIITQKQALKLEGDQLEQLLEELESMSDAGGDA